MKTYVIDVNTSRTPEEGAQSPSWPNRLLYHSFVLAYPRVFNCRSFAQLHFVSLQGCAHHLVFPNGSLTRRSVRSVRTVRNSQTYFLHAYLHLQEAAASAKAEEELLQDPVYQVRARHSLNIWHYSGNIWLHSGNIWHHSANIWHHSWNIRHISRNIWHNSGNIWQYSGNILHNSVNIWHRGTLRIRLTASRISPYRGDSRELLLLTC
jgi:hypothetical protein